MAPFILGLDPRRERHRIMQDVCFIADVAVLPKWLRVRNALDLVDRLHPRFERSRAEDFLSRTTVRMDSKIGQLSKGMVTQLHLALVMAIEARLLVLDEPTNDLDVETLRALEDALVDFAGCAVVISHDRFFLDRICTHILAFEGDSKVTFFAGNYADYEEDRKRRLGAEADSPHRIKYKRLDA